MSVPSTSLSKPGPGPDRRRGALAVLALAQLMVVLDATIVNRPAAAAVSAAAPAGSAAGSTGPSPTAAPEAARGGTTCPKSQPAALCPQS